MYLIVAFRSDEESSAPRIVGIVGLVLGVLMGVAAGYSMAVGRADWNNIVLPVAYLGSAVAMGGSLFASLMAVLREEAPDFRKVALISLVGAVVQAIGFVVFGALTGFAVDAVLYWVGAIAVGTVVPLICLAASPKARALVFASLICSVAGALCLRAVVLAMGTTSLGLIANAASRSPILAGSLGFMRRGRRSCGGPGRLWTCSCVRWGGCRGRPASPPPCIGRPAPFPTDSWNRGT